MAARDVQSMTERQRERQTNSDAWNTTIVTDKRNTVDQWERNTS